MNDFILALRNLRRNTRRSILSISAIVFATALLIFMLSFQFGVYEDMIDSSVRHSTGHLQITQPGYHQQPRMRNVVTNPQAIEAAAKSIADITAITLRSETFVLASGENRSKGLLLTGVEPENEKIMSLVPNQMVAGRYLNPGDHGAAVMGVLAARNLHMEVGDECVFLGYGRDGSIAAGAVKIVGIYESGIDEFDRSSMQIPLGEFDRVFSMMGGVHRVVMTVDNLAKTYEVVKTLTMATEDLSAMSWDEMTPGLKQSIELDFLSGAVMYVILVVVVACSILNTFFMAIFERKREFGVLMSIGMKPGRLVRLMLLESMSMTVTGLLLGMILGIAVTLASSHWGIGLGKLAEFTAQFGLPARLYPKLTVLSVILGPLLICFVTFITALIPVLKIPRMQPVEALRS